MTDLDSKAMIRFVDKIALTHLIETEKIKARIAEHHIPKELSMDMSESKDYKRGFQDAINKTAEVIEDRIKELKLQGCKYA